MGIFQESVYNMCCDGCGKNFGCESEELYPDEECLRFAAEESEWKNINGEWLCPDCYEINKDGEYVKRKKE